MCQNILFCLFVCLKMPFEKKCSVKIHQTICKNSASSTIFRIDGKKVRASVVETLKSEGHLSDKAKYICEECVKYTEVYQFF